MAIPVDIETLLSKRNIEGDRIEFKKGWNPTRIYRSICAFANDFDNIGGGYIIVGVAEENGIAKRPVEGIPVDSLDNIMKDMVGFNNMIKPYYLPKVSVEDVDGKKVLVIWVPGGMDRPYSAPSDVNAKLKDYKFYIRSGSSTIEAKDAALEELRGMANRTPFDDRGNPDITIDDISPVLVHDYLRKVGSSLAKDFGGSRIEDILDQMDMYSGPVERRHLKNIAAMMFSEAPDRFFPYTRVEIVVFPEGRENNPNHMIEVPLIKGPVPTMINAALGYLKTNVIKEHIIKQKFDATSLHIFNYPYQALEEAVVNALYHRSYQEHEPVTITIEPNCIEITSVTGPDRSISDAALKEAKVLKSKRYRNRRLGDFLKELGLSEGRCTGMPTIQEELKKNGSAPAVIETDAERTYFSIIIPCREGFGGHEPQDGAQNGPQNGPQNINFRDESRATKVLHLIQENPSITKPELAERLAVGETSIRRILTELRKDYNIVWTGPSKGGHWEVSEKQ